MPTAAIRPPMSDPSPATLYLAFELGNTEWRLAFTTSVDRPPRVRTIVARSLTQLEAELATAKGHFDVGPEVPVRSCYEAGRDGFWLHRALLSRGIANVVVDSSSIEVNRRARRGKSDGLDAGKLLTMLMRASLGDPKVWSVLHVPTVAAEDRRQLHRELIYLRRDRTRLTNRIKGLLASQGMVFDTLSELPTQLSHAQLWDGTPVPSALCARLGRDWQLVTMLTTRLRLLRQERLELLRTHPDDPALQRVRQLLMLRGIGMESAWLYVMEFFGWRQFQNRRQVGALAGLTPTPYQSGDRHREQGMSKAGNR